MVKQTTKYKTDKELRDYIFEELAEVCELLAQAEYGFDSKTQEKIRRKAEIFRNFKEME